MNKKLVLLGILLLVGLMLPGCVGVAGYGGYGYGYDYGYDYGYYAFPHSRGFHHHDFDRDRDDFHRGSGRDPGHRR